MAASSHEDPLPHEAPFALTKPDLAGPHDHQFGCLYFSRDSPRERIAAGRADEVAGGWQWAGAGVVERDLRGS